MESLVVRRSSRINDALSVMFGYFFKLEEQTMMVLVARRKKNVIF